MGCVVITGCSSGIGLEAALAFGRRGDAVLAGVRRRESMAHVASQAQGLPVEPVLLDVTDSDSIARVVDAGLERHGSIDVLVNNAGINRDAPFLEMTDEDWDAVMSTNLTGVFLCCQEAARMMMAGDGGSIVNISAVTTILARANSVNYIASKGAMNAMTRAMAVELGPKVTVNAIALGFVDSPLVRELFSAERLAEIENSLLSGRIGTFAEVSAMVQYLASDDAGFVTGQVMSLDGGQAIKLA